MDKKSRYRQVAALHAANINQGFLATLGLPFLTLMYRAIDESPDSVLLTEERDGHVLGFVSGGKGMTSIYRQMVRRPFSLGIALLPSLVHVTRMKRIFDILRYGRRRGMEVVLPESELLSIAVDKEARGTGVAESLYRGLVAHFGEKGAQGFRITVGDALVPAHRFYTRMGAVPVARTEVHAGQGSRIYVHHIGSDFDQK